MMFRAVIALSALLALSTAAIAEAGDEATVSIHAFPSAEELAAMKEAGVKRIVNFRSTAEMDGEERDLAAEAEALGMSYHHIPVGGTDGISPAAARALDRILDAESGDVALFCRSGMRAAHALAARYMADGMSEADARAKTGWKGVWSDNMLSEMTENPEPPAE